MTEKHHVSDPEFYEGPLSEQASQDRATMESRVDDLDAEAEAETSPIKAIKLERAVEAGLESLALQGANPKAVPFERLKAHVQGPLYNDMPLANEYRAKIKNRATAIRAYCVGSCMLNVAEVRDCTSVNCPLHPFRMGKDPLRGWGLPKAEDPELPEDDDDTGAFEEGDDDND